MSYALVDTAPEFCQKCDIFPEKRMEGIFFMLRNIMLNLAILDKMQNISTLMRKSSESEGRAF